MLGGGVEIVWTLSGDASRWAVTVLHTSVASVAVAMDPLLLGLRRESSQEQRAAGGIREGDKRLQAAAGSNRSAGAARAPQTGRHMQRTLGGRRADMLSRG